MSAKVFLLQNTLYLAKIINVKLKTVKVYNEDESYEECLELIQKHTVPLYCY